MDGVFVLEGLYNGPFGPATLQSAQPVTALGADSQLMCSFQNHSSFKAWHDQAWFKDPGPVPLRSYMASSFAQPVFDSAGHAKLVTDAVTSLPGGAINTMFGVQTGGMVSRPPEAANATSVSPAFRSSVALQENDSDWLFSWSDATQVGWAHSVGDSVAALAGFGGAYVNEPDPAIPSRANASSPAAGYEDRFWGAATFARLQRVKRAWDPLAMFGCHQCVYN